MALFEKLFGQGKNRGGTNERDPFLDESLMIRDTLNEEIPYETPANVDFGVAGGTIPTIFQSKKMGIDSPNESSKVEGNNNLYTLRGERPILDTVPSIAMSQVEESRKVFGDDVPMIPQAEIEQENSHLKNFQVVELPVEDIKIDRPQFAEQKSVFQAGEHGIDYPEEGRRGDLIPGGIDGMYAAGSLDTREAVRSVWDDPAALVPDEVRGQSREDGGAYLAKTLEEIAVEELTMEEIDKIEKKKVA